MKKRLTALLIALMMAMAMIPTTALAEDLPETTVDTPETVEQTPETMAGTLGEPQGLDQESGMMGTTDYGPSGGGGGQGNKKALTINIEGSGTVTTSPPGQESGGKRYYDKDTMVTLTATPAHGWQFTGFTGTTNGNNKVKMDRDREVTASFTKCIYKVKFYYGAHGTWVSGSGNPKEVSVTFGEMPTAPGVKANKGYDFTGWSPGLAPADEGQSYTAQYQCIEYKITYDLGGGVADNPEKYTIETPTFKLKNPTRTGYIFQGWSGTGICGSTMQVTIPKGSTDDRQYKALWKAITYTVVYDKNTGDGGVTANSAHTYDVAAKLTKNGYYKAGHTFLGWALSSDATAPDYTDGQNVTNLTDVDKGVVKLFAVWKIKTFEVRFFEQDGVTQIGDTQTVNWNSAAALETAPDVAGHTFDKWVLTGNDDTQPDSLTNVREKIDAVAAYTRNSYLVTFVDFEGKEIGTDTVLYGEGAKAPDVPAREGYTFTGWDKDFSHITDTLTVTAQYKLNTYIVTFVDHNGTVLGTQTVNHGAAASAPAVPAREGYTFTGWDKDFSKITGALTVTAQYKLNTYIVTFVDHNGTVLSTQTVNHGAAAVAPANPKRSDYTFTGWDKDFSKITSALTVTAQYKKNVTSSDESIPGTSDSGAQPFPWLWIAVAAALAGGIMVIVVTQVRRGKKTGDTV